MSSGLTPGNIRGGLRPITASINSPAMIPRPSLMSQSLYLVPRGNINQMQPVSQPSLLHVRSLAHGQPVTQGNGMPGIPPQTRPYSPTINTIVAPGLSESPLVKFIKQLMELSQKSTSAGTQGIIVKLIQQLIDEEIDCDVFCTQLCDCLNSVKKRTDLESLLKNNIVQLRRSLADGACSIPHINPPSRPPPNIPSTTVFVNPATILNSASSASQILPRPPEGLPANATFQLSQAATVTIAPTLPRPTTPLVQNSVFTSRPITTTIASSTNQPIRPQLKPAQPLPLRVKTPVSSAIFQPASGITAMAPQRGSLFATAATVRPLYPTTIASSPSIVSSPTVTVATTAPAASSTVVSPPNQMNQPFFPVSQIRSYLASQLPATSTNMLSEEALNCLAHGLDAFLRSILTRVSVVVGHKAVKLSDDPHLKQMDYTREQLNYLQRLGEHDKQKQSELEKEYILKAAKSRTRSENPDQARLREMAHQLKNEQYERERQQQANWTALNAIGLPANRRPRPPLNPSSSDQGLSTADSPSSTAPRLSLLSANSRLRLVHQASPSGSPSTTVVGGLGQGSTTTTPRFTLAASLRTRRAGLRELQVVLASDPRLCRSRAFYRSHWR
ncbi:unnamed protein product [Mesocestoides corti]|nr:unnamed protein product [Mesocestoides corti]